MLKIQGRFSGPLSIVCVDPVNQLRMSTLFSTRFMEIYQFCLYPTVCEDCIYFCSSDPFPKSSNMPSVGSFCIVFNFYLPGSKFGIVEDEQMFFRIVHSEHYDVKFWHWQKIYAKIIQKRWKTELDLTIVFESFNHYFFKIKLNKRNFNISVLKS